MGFFSQIAAKPAVPNVTLVYLTPTTIFFELHPPKDISPQFPITYYTVKHVLLSEIAKTETYAVMISKQE